MSGGVVVRRRGGEVGRRWWWWGVQPGRFKPGHSAAAGCEELDSLQDGGGGGGRVGGLEGRRSLRSARRALHWLQPGHPVAGNEGWKAAGGRGGEGRGAAFDLIHC